MNLTIKKMETDDEIKGKAYVHWKAWHEAYSGIVDPQYLDKLTLEKCETITYQWPDNIIIAKDSERVIGFAGYGKYHNDELENTGEIFAIYILAEYYGKGVGYQLMQAGLSQLSDYPQTAVWVLKENKRAVRFYERCGFRPDGCEQTIRLGTPVTEIRMIIGIRKKSSPISDLS